jgi:hypothetical protein
MSLHELNDFFVLSAKLRYQLDVGADGRANILALILGRARLPDADRRVLIDVIDYLCHAYEPRTRRLGTPSVLHPLRSAALLVQCAPHPDMLDLLTTLLHDKFEDITPKRFTPDAWSTLEADFARIVGALEENRRWYLMERLSWLTRADEVTYNAYIGNLLEHTGHTPELMRAKLVDRLDNTLDLRVAVSDPIEGTDFFRTLFEILFVNGFKGYHPENPHGYTSSPYNGSERLYQLFKNAVMLSLVRQARVKPDVVTQGLFEALAWASMKEAERIALHLFGYHLVDLKTQRALLQETMDYAQRGGLDEATARGLGGRIDGLFASLFEAANTGARKVILADLYRDKPRMLEAALAFVVIFLAFLDDPGFYVHNVDEKGVHGSASVERGADI